MGEREESFPPPFGSTLLINGELRPVAAHGNPGEFNLKRFRAGENVIGLFHCKSILEAPVQVKLSPTLAIRKWLADSCDRLALQDAPLWKGLLLGFRRDLDPSLMEQLRVTGLTHLLALSGLNIGFLALAFIGLGSLLRLSLLNRFLLAIVLVLLYSQVIPERGSTLRATIMTLAIMLGYLFRRWTPQLNSIGLAGLIILAYRPLDLFEAGFQLSFAATGAIFLFEADFSRLNNWRRGDSGRVVRIFRHWIMVPFVVSIACSAFTAPLTSYHFSSIPLGGPFFNLIAVPILGVVYAGAWLAVSAQIFGTSFPQLIADGVLAISASWQEVTRYFAVIAPEWKYTLPPWSLSVLLGLLIWGAISIKPLLKRLIILVFGISATIIFATIKTSPTNFKTLFLDVGHGDAQLWRFPDGKTILIDCGPVPSTAIGRVDKVLRRLNIDKVDLLVATHPDADHIGGFNTLVKEFTVEKAVSTLSENSSNTLLTLEAISLQKSLVWNQISVGDTIAGLADGYTLEVLNPPPLDLGWSDNDLSIVLKLTVPVGAEGEITLLSTGDIERAAEVSLVKDHILKADLLKVPHHGSPTSSTDEFIKAVSAEFGIVSRGWGDERVSAKGRLEVINRYEFVGTELHFTDKEGAILMEATPDGWQMVDWRHPSFSSWILGGI